MAIQNIQRTFGAFAGQTAPQAGAAKEQKPKAQFWLNVGYDSGIPDENGDNKFVSLPVGIPLDGMELLSTSSRNKDFAAFQAARNDLYEQIMEICKSLEPGEAKIIGGSDDGLQIQIRRINDEAAAPDMATNQFAKKLTF